ncbi:MAG: U32 family peptidase [Chloroflexi bacterium]|nr:U32 family peptidase [Chloroflexota bacterium]
MTMRVLVPVDKPEQVAILAKAGATQFYCGFLAPQWLQHYSNPALSRMSAQLAPNHRSLRTSNLQTFEELRKLIQEAHRFSIPVYLAVNHPSFVEENYPALLDDIRSAANAGVDGLIIADPGLILAVTALDLGLSILLSTLTQVANVESVRFFQELGVSAINFPRHVTLEEIEHITNQVPGMGYECFIMDERCAYDDGNCNVLHCSKEKDFFCREQYFSNFASATSSSLTLKEWQALESHEASYRQWISRYPDLDMRKNDWQNTGCGICAIPFLLRKTRVTGFKIAGRGSAMSQKLKSLSLVTEAIRLAEKGAGPQQIREMARSAQPLPELCDLRYLCYFPDAFDIERSAI